MSENFRVFIPWKPHYSKNIFIKKNLIYAKRPTVFCRSLYATIIKRSFYQSKWCLTCYNVTNRVEPSGFEPETDWCFLRFTKAFNIEKRINMWVLSVHLTVSNTLLYQVIAFIDMVQYFPFYTSSLSRGSQSAAPSRWKIRLWI